MTKIVTVALILVIMFTISLFASHFGYRVNGVPKGDRPTFHTIGIGNNTGDEATTQYIVYFDDGTQAIMTMGEIQEMIHANPLGDVFGFMSGLATASIDNMPVFITYIFWVIALIIGFLIWTTFVPFMQSGG